MNKLWGKDPKKELSKRLTKLAEMHREISNNKSREGCEDFSKKLHETVVYLSENFGQNNFVYNILALYCGMCQRVQVGGGSISLYRAKHTRIPVPPFSVKPIKIGNVKFIQKSYINVNLDPKIFCKRLSQNLENIRVNLVPILEYKRK